VITIPLAFAGSITQSQTEEIAQKSTSSGWQLDASLPSNMSPAVSWDCIDFPQSVGAFAHSYVEKVFIENDCVIEQEDVGPDETASVSVRCDLETMKFDFKRTSDTTIGVQEIETAGASRVQFLSLFKQCDTKIVFDCSPEGQAGWRATRPGYAINYDCGEADPETFKASVKPDYDFGFPIEIKKFKVMDRPGEDVDNGLPEQCNWYEVDGEQFCYAPTVLEQFVDNPHAISLANIAIEVNVGETEFSGDESYCEDVKALAAQMPWHKGITCEIQAEAK
jgi:hypothetical protein